MASIAVSVEWVLPPTVKAWLATVPAVAARVEWWAISVVRSS
jgi:hypothetical protein